MRLWFSLLCAVSLPAFAMAQSTTCNTFGRSIQCDTTPAPDYSGMSQFGAALGAKIRANRDQKSAAAVLEKQRQCLVLKRPVAATYQDCINQSAVRLDAPGEQAQSAITAAKAMCRTEANAVSAALSECEAEQAAPAFQAMVQEDAMAAILTARAQKRQN